MSKEKLKQNVNPVGATSSRPHFEEIAKKQKGITLIALIITIIVMLILVGVSVTVALNGGLFTTAKNAVDETQAEKDKEMGLSEGKVEIGGKEYDSYQDYLDKKPSSAWKETTKLSDWTNNNVKAMTDGTNIIPLPEGYSISEEEGENIVSEGLVITDGENEFVWIPVPKETAFGATYTTYGVYSEPTILEQDTQANLNSYYGDDYYIISNTDEYQNNVNNKFAYKAHYAEMIESVNKYNGFYIGRYETTIDENKIGSKEGATILSTDQSIAQTNNKLCRWWGLYAVQRNSDVKGNGSIVQTNMIWGQQWEAMITFFENESKDYSDTTVEVVSTKIKQNAGQAKYTYNSKTISDEICNIYDLRGNVYDWIAEAYVYSEFNKSERVGRGRLQFLHGLSRYS